MMGGCKISMLIYGQTAISEVTAEFKHLVQNQQLFVAEKVLDYFCVFSCWLFPVPVDMCVKSHLFSALNRTPVHLMFKGLCDQNKGAEGG